MLARLTLLLALVAPPALAGDLEMVISRNDTTATLYIRSPLTLVPEVFQTDLLANGPPALTTALDVEALLAVTVIETPIQQLVFEPMSAMAHPSADRLPFGAPWEASTATTVCSDIDVGTPITSRTHDVYAGFVARDIKGLDEITVRFAQSTATPIGVTIHDFAAGQAQRSVTWDLSSARSVTLAAASPRLGTAHALLALIASIILLSAVMFWRSRHLRSARA